jgi:sigma-B regulation protein RsbU (phosphoserine phosphatase)
VPKLISIEGPTQGRKYDLEDENLLGRSPSCLIYIGDLTVSRQHARLLKTDRGFVVEDLGSGNGTFVNDSRVNQHLLRDSDEVRISDSVFRFEAEKPSEARWVNMVTVMASDEAGLIAVDSNPTMRLQDTLLGEGEDDLRADLTKAHRMLGALYAVSDATSSMLEPTKLFNMILDYLFKVFQRAERGFIMQLDERKQLVPAAIRRRKGEERAEGLVVSQSLVSQVMHEGKSVLSTGGAPQEAPIDWRHTGAGVSKMGAPLVAGGETLGILHIEGRAGAAPFTQEDLDLMTGIARQAGVAALNASLHQRLMRQQYLEQDLRFAKRVQQSFLPAEPPDVPGVCFHRHYTPYYDVGGDFYDFIPLHDGKVGVLIGDVSGKGVSAALLMARLASDLRYFAISCDSPAEVLEQANAALIERVQDNMFATVLYLVLDPATGTATISNGGHLPPFVRLASDGTVLELDEGTNLALGVLPDTTFEQISIELKPGDTVLLCTDGVVEAKNALGDEFGFERLNRALSRAPTGAPLDGILKDLMHYTGASAQYDDITAVAFTYGQENPR